MTDRIEPKTSPKDLRALAVLMRADPECDAAASMVNDAADEIERLQSFFARTGETLADGLKRADAAYEQLRSEIRKLLD